MKFILITIIIILILEFIYILLLDRDIRKFKKSVMVLNLDKLLEYLGKDVLSEFERDLDDDLNLHLFERKIWKDDNNETTNR